MGYIGNAPYQGVITGNNIADGSVDTADLKDSAVTVGKLASTLDLSGKTVTLPAGVGGHASGTEANRPASPAVGTIYFNTDQDTLQQYKSTGWEDVGTTPPNIGGITGTIYNGIATSLVISGNGFGTASTVRFTVGGSATDVSVSNNDTTITVNVPSAIYNQAAGTTVSVSVIVNGLSTAGSNRTVNGAPTGGTVTTTGNYFVHTFLTSGTFSVPSGLSLADVEYVVVGGGGSGGGWGCAGGGGGGYRSSVSGENSGRLSSPEAKLSLSAGNYSVVIGQGSPGTDTTPSNGSSTTFGSITALGGGSGGGNYGGSWFNPGDAGCGGGSAWVYLGMDGQGGLGTSGQGFNGGSVTWSNTGKHASGGGGGAGQIGESPASSNDDSGDGGNGIQTFIDGNNYYYAGGGGGSIHPTVDLDRCGNGGLGGGGGGSGGDIGGTGGGTARNSGGNGTDENGAGIGGHGGANTGGGGGGGKSATSSNGGNGGSGIVIIRYQLPT